MDYRSSRGMTMYVDMGLHAMGTAIDSPAYEGLDKPPMTPGSTN